MPAAQRVQVIVTLDGDRCVQYGLAAPEQAMLDYYRKRLSEQGWTDDSDSNETRFSKRQQHLEIDYLNYVDNPQVLACLK